MYRIKNKDKNRMECITKDKVLVLMPYLFRGGSEKQIRYIIEGLEKAKIPVIALIETGTELEDENKLYIEKHPEIQFVFFNRHTDKESDRTIVKKSKSIIVILKWMKKNLRKNGVKWVMFTNLTGLVTVPFCELYGCKVLFNERNPGIKMCDNFYKRFLLKMCDKVVANSKSAAIYMSKILNISVECINNGVLVNGDSINKENPEETIILVPARITPIKNQNIVLKAMLKLNKIIKCKLIMAGEIDDEDYYCQLVDFIKKNQLQENVEILGYVSNIQTYYSKASVVILPSYEEGTPNVILESFLTHNLCLASDIIMNTTLQLYK